MPSINDFKDAVSAVPAERPKGFPALLDAYKGEVIKALPEHLKKNIDRYTRIALTCYRQNPKLAECDPRSVFAAVILSGQLGLELGVLGQAYLVPYKGEATFVPGWRGYVDLVHRAGRAVVWTGAVFEGDVFDYQMGDTPFVRHKPAGEDDPGKITHTYAVGRIKGIDWPIIEVFTALKLAKHFKRYNKVGEKHYAHANWESYARKVALLQVVKYLPASVEIGQLQAMESSADVGQQNLSVKDAIEGTFTPAPFDEPAPPQSAGSASPGPYANGPSSAAGGGPTPEQAFADAYELMKQKDYDGAAALLPLMTEKDRTIIEGMLKP